MAPPHILSRLTVSPWMLVLGALSAAAFPAVSQAQTGLVAAWSFNEGAGTTVADASGNNNTGTISGATWSTLGRYGNALSFDGVNNVVVVNSSASLNLTTGMTLSAWVYPTATQSDWHAIVQKEVDAYFLHASNSTGALRPAAGGTFNGVARNLAAPSAISVGAWTHLAVTYDAAAIRLFVNGTQVATVARTGTLETNTNPLRIGGNSPYGEYFLGRIDDVRIYNRALNATEIQNDMAVSVGVPVPPDVTVPTVTITTPTANPTLAVTATPLALGGSAGDNVAVTQVSWTNNRGGSGIATGTTAWSTAGIPLLTGDNVLTVTARDAAGNLATDVLTVTYTPPPDVTAPTVTITTPTANPTLTVATTPLTLGGTAGDNVGVTQVSWTNDRGGSGTATGTTTWSAPGIALLSGDNVLTVTARDAAGNLATDVLTVTYAPDVTVPTVTITTPTANPTLAVTATPLTLGGTAGDNVAVTQVSWTNNRGGSGTATGTTAWSTAGIALLSGDNILTVTARDAAGNVATDVLTVTYSPDVTVPTVTITTPTANPTLAVTTTPVTLGGTAGDNVAVTQVSWTNNRGGSGTATGTTAWSTASIALLSGDNILTVTARDAAGNLATDVLTITYSPPDVTVPTVTITTPTANPTLTVTATPVTLGGTASDNVGVTQVSWTNDRGGSGTAAGTTAWSASGIALLSGDNVLTVTARDAAGNVATDILTVTYSSDVTVPTVTITTPTANPTLAVTATPLTLGGTAGDNVGVTQVSWTSDRGGSGIATGTTAWSTAAIALLSGDNVLTVTARDAAGNVATDVLTVAYTPPPDVTAPTVTITIPTANPTLTVTATPVTLGGTAGDNVGVTQVSWTNDRGGSGTATGTTAWSASGIALLSGDNVLTVTARDAGGNVATDVLTVTYQPGVPPSGLVAAWAFNEGTGTTAADISGNNNTGTITGATWSTQGRYGNALDFNGVNNVVIINSSASLNLTTGMTLSAWVFPTSTQSDWHAVVQREVDAYFLHASNSTGPLRPAAGGTFNGVGKNFAAPSAIAVGAWTHLAVTYDGAALRLFINGAQVATSPQTGSLETNTNPLRIGGNSPYGEYFLGRIDDVRIYNRALTATELQNDMAVSVGGSAPPDVTVPTVTITTPTANPTLAVTATPLTLGGTASDNVGVTQVSWTNNRGGSGTATGTTAWSTAGIALLSGDNILTVTARDAAGNVATDILTVTYSPDVTVPTVTITTPTANPTLAVTATPLTLGGTAGDNVAVTQVSWTNDRGGSGIATGTTAWSTAGIALLSGDNVLTVTARDAAGNLATDVLTVTFSPPPDPTPPAVTITTPTANPTLAVTATPLTLAGTASDNVGVTQVSWTNDRGGSGTATGTTAWSASGIALLRGDNVLTVTARDAAGNLATDVLTVTYQPAPPPSGLVAAWGFNEGVGTTVADVSGNNNTGTITGATWSTQGRYGNALDFNGVNNVVVVNSSPSLNLTADMTISAWVFPTATQSDWHAVVQREVDAYFLHASNSTGPLRPAAGGTFNGANKNLVAPNAIAVGAWTHLAVTYNAATIRLYVNGIQVATAPQTGALETNTKPLRIGGNSPYGEYFLGRIDDVRIYDRALTATEIQSDMAVSVSMAPPRLVLLQPAAGSAIYSTTVPVTYTTTGDLAEVNHVHFKLDANPEVMDLSFDGAYQFTNVLVGPHVLQGYLVRADHSKIPDTDASVSFTTAATDPTPPSVTITTPLSGSTLSGTVTVTATASDNTGVVAGVQFLLDGAPLGAEVTAEPYSIDWNTLATTNASHTLTARARDGAGNQAVSTAVGVTVVNNTSTDPAVVGQWGTVMNWPLVSINMTLMPNGKVLLYDDHTNATGAGVFDPATLIVTTVPFLTANLFCSGQNLLPDGRVFVAGGHTDVHVGIANGTIFNPTTQTWSSAAPMAVGRWYPTVTTLPDGRMLTLGGEVSCNDCNALVPEVFDPATGTWTRLTGAPFDLQYYPHAFVIPDGRILVTGANKLEMPTYALNVATQTWTTVDPTVLHAGSSVMYLPGKFMKSGRGRDPDLPGAPSVATTYVLDMTAPTPQWRQTASMAFPRTEHNLTLLADGTVLTSGGGINSDVFDPNAPVLLPELWDPATEVYKLMAPMPRPRIYHSTAVLMPDGRVLSGGGGRWGPSYLEGEFYSPPYLFKGARPTITSAPGTLGYNANFFVGTAATGISAVNLLRLGAVTHAFNQNQRFLKLTFQPTAGGLTVQSPSGATLAPPGHYMLFILNANGVPSVASIVKIQ